MHTFIITRFSIYDPVKKFKRADKSHLFSEKRLKFKFESFERITLPSIINQTNQNYTYLIFSSIYLPKIYKQRLLNLTKKYYKKIHCIFVNDLNQFYSTLTNLFNKLNKPYCSIRLDDDDGLNVKFIESLNQYKHLDKSIISHPRGTNFKIENGKILYGKKTNYPKTAQGLAAINMDIYSCGDHTKVDKKYNVIYDTTPDMYLINCNDLTDTKRIFE